MKARNRAKLAVRRSPALWSSYVTVSFPPRRFRSTRDQMCLPSHDLLLDGYPRSANSYVFNFVRRFVDDVRCVHHSHASATLKMADRFDVPSFVLLRDPLDAVTSNVIRSGGNLAYHEAHYEQYYRCVADELDDVTVIPFETATQDPVTVLNTVETELGLPPSDPSPERIEEVNRSIEDHLEHIAQQTHGEDAAETKAVPDERRDRQKARVRAELADREPIQRLRDLHAETLELSRWG